MFETESMLAREIRIVEFVQSLTQLEVDLLARLNCLCFDQNEMSGVGRRIIRAGGWQVAKRIIKPIPIIGSVFAFGLAGYEIKKKGLIPGVVHVGLDITPVIGTAKNVVEIFTGDLIPDKKDRKKKLIPPINKPSLRSEEHTS